MESQAVLIFGNHVNRKLVQCVASTGLKPQVCTNMQQCLDKLVHERFAAVVIDRKLADADVLELILNVRDIDKTTPVAVIGRGKDEHIERKIIDQDHTIVLAEIEKVETLTQKLTDALHKKEDENI